MIWSRALGFPLERPKSLSTDGLIALVGWTEEDWYRCWKINKKLKLQLKELDLIRIIDPHRVYAGVDLYRPIYFVSFFGLPLFLFFSFPSS